ncbi:hypothetical protein NMG60_11015225 [Bertholletia excelsa]
MHPTPILLSQFTYSRRILTSPSGLLLLGPKCSVRTHEPHHSNRHCHHLLQRCIAASSSLNGKAIHAKFLKSNMLSTLFYVNQLLNVYLKSGEMFSSVQLFDEMPQRNVVSWTLLIGGFVKHGYSEDAISLFCRMHGQGMKPNEFTFLSALQACSSPCTSTHFSHQIYAFIIRSGFESNTFLFNAFLTSLIRHSKLAEASGAFENYLNKDIISWNAMMAGYLQLSSSEIPILWHRIIHEGVTPDNFTFASVLSGLASLSDLTLGVQVHAQLVKSGHGNEICVGNSLVDMYLKAQNFEDGLKAFGEIPTRDVWSWTQMASGCIQCGKPKEALGIVGEMRKVGIKPNKFTLATAINACANSASLEEGKKLHSLKIKLGEDIDICVDNALIDMYARCGFMEGALGVFQSMDDRSVVSWTTMIMGYAQNGQSGEAVRIFEEMRQEGVMPNYVTFICVLYACSHGGLVEEGFNYFNSMEDYGVAPGEDHYACMVDLLGRAGRVKEAEELIKRKPLKSGVLVWKTLLSACQVHGDAEIAIRAGKHVMDMDKEDPSAYVLLSNTLAGLRNWDGVSMLRELMENREVKKMPASSWIETNRDHALPGRG